jgi:hypothetical protein
MPTLALNEFPKLRSATGGIRLLQRSLHRFIRPSGGEDPRQVNAQARVFDRAIRRLLCKLPRRGVALYCFDHDSGTRAAGSGEGDQKLVQWQVQQRGQLLCELPRRGIALPQKLSIEDSNYFEWNVQIPAVCLQHVAQQLQQWKRGVCLECLRAHVETQLRTVGALNISCIQPNDKLSQSATRDWVQYAHYFLTTESQLGFGQESVDSLTRNTNATIWKCPAGCGYGDGILLPDTSCRVPRLQRSVLCELSGPLARPRDVPALSPFAPRRARPRGSQPSPANE